MRRYGIAALVIFLLLMLGVGALVIVMSQRQMVAKLTSGSCGSRWHEGLRFDAVDVRGIEIYYQPLHNVYDIKGTVRVHFPNGHVEIVSNRTMAGPGPVELWHRQKAPPPYKPGPSQVVRDAKGTVLGAGDCIGSIHGGSCGSPYHDRIRFECTDNKGIKVFYLPARNSYYVAGKARVTWYGWFGKPRAVKDCENELVIAPGQPKVR